MQIRGKTVFVFDIEVFHNIFHCSVKNSETKEITKFEISPRINLLQKLVEFFKQPNAMFCGYNNIHYDNPIINYIIEYEDKLMSHNVYTICESIFHLSKIITESTEDNIDAWKHWKYLHMFDSFDLLTMLYSNKLRVSLKELQVTMQYPTVQEFLVDWDRPLPIDKFDEMIQYNLNDIESTSELLEQCKKDIDLRISIEDEYGVDVLSKDGVNIGMKILAQKYLEKTGLQWADIKDLRSPIDFISLNKVILPFIRFDSPLLQGILEEMKQQTVSPGRKGYEKNFVFDGLRYTIGVGGIHSKNDPEKIIPKDDEVLADIDVSDAAS